jgi:hypothetical protein
VFSSIPFDDSKSYMEVEILKLPKGGEEVFIGITKNLKQKSSKNNITVHLAGKFKNNVEGPNISFSEGDTIGILVDHKKLLSTFYKNGEECGIKGKLKGNQTYYFVVHFFNEGDSFKIKEFKVKE